MRKIFAFLFAVSLLALTALPAFAASATPVQLEFPSSEDESAVSFLMQIRLTATDQTGKPVPDAVFSLHRADTGQALERLTTDRSGVAISGEIEGNTDYYLKELTTPEGYFSQDEPVKIPMDGAVPSCVDVAVYYMNAGSVMVQAADASGKEIRGMRFEIYNLDSNVYVGKLVTDDTGTASMMLPMGSYQLEEIGDAEPVPFTLTVDEPHAELYIIDGEISAPQDGSVQLTAICAEDGGPLSGAVIGVYDETGARIDRLTTDRTGEACIALPAGEYVLRELSAPEGYVLSEKEIPVSMKAGMLVRLTVEHTPQPEAESETEAGNGRLMVVNRDAATGYPIAGAVFGVYDDAGNRVEKLTTDENGAAEVKLEPGEYMLRQEDVPEPFILEKSEIAFSLDGAEDTVTVNLSNISEEEVIVYLEGENVEASGSGQAESDIISIPQTGGLFPMKNALLSLLCWIAATACFTKLAKKIKR